jgi:predicted DNA-binding transcriptional regulator AlpA
MSAADNDDRIVLLEEACRLAGDVDPSTLWRWQRDPRVAFPMHVQLGPQKRAWWLSELQAWLRARPRAERPSHAKDGQAP